MTFCTVFGRAATDYHRYTSISCLAFSSLAKTGIVRLVNFYQSGYAALRLTILAISPSKTKQYELYGRTITLISLARQARGHWFESSIAHIVNRWDTELRLRYITGGDVKENNIEKDYFVTRKIGKEEMVSGFTLFAQCCSLSNTSKKSIKWSWQISPPHYM